MKNNNYFLLAKHQQLITSSPKMLKRMALCPTFSNPKLHNNKSFKKPQQQKHTYPLNKSRSQCNLTNPSIPPKPSTNKHHHKQQPKPPQLSSSFLNESSCTKSSTKIVCNNDQSDILLIKKSPSYGLIHTNTHKPKPKTKPQNEVINLNHSDSIPLKRSNSMILQDNNNLIKQYPVSKLSSNRNNLSNSICSSQPNNTRLDSSTTAATYKSFCK